LLCFVSNCSFEVNPFDGYNNIPIFQPRQSSQKCHQLKQTKITKYFQKQHTNSDWINSIISLFLSPPPVSPSILFLTFVVYQLQLWLNLLNNWMYFKDIHNMFDILENYSKARYQLVLKSLNSQWNHIKIDISC